MSVSSTKLDNHLKELEGDILKLKKDFFSIIKKFNLVKKELKKTGKISSSNNFTEPILYNLNNKLCSILKIEPNKEIIFSLLNKKINEYLSNHNLISKDNNKIIINDELKVILKETRTYKFSKLTHTNIHLYLKHNYTIKSNL